ncbi:hypothetical protein FB451DRAFT_1192628 [Mycena latifolia]|nr:hypothetical protein FB451DRAFT_1192628 [Mycena latifolia]
MDPEEIDMLYAFRPGTSRLILRGLNSLFAVPPPRTRFGLRQTVTVLHASVPDYLYDPRRSAGWASIICLPDILRETTPTAALIALLRDKGFQNNIFLSELANKPHWPQRGSPYPSDLIHVWEEHRFLLDLASHLRPSKNSSAPTFKFDSIYREIFTEHRQLLSVMRHIIMAPGRAHHVLAVFGPEVNYRVLRPLLIFRDHIISLPFPGGDSPIDFLNDQDRAGDLYSDVQDIAQEMVLLWIRRAKKVLEGDDLWLYPPSSKILRELESLTLGDLCRQMVIDPEAHEYAHRNFLHPIDLNPVLDWLLVGHPTKFPEPSMGAIAFWERQLAEIRGCRYYYC